MSRNARGFTLVELLVTLALVAIATTVVLPYGVLVETRAKEAELRTALRTIRRALDEYKAASDAGLIEKPTGSSGFPRNLEVLVAGMQSSAAFGGAARPVVFLRNVPRDPFHPDRSLPASATWNLRSYGAAPGDFSAGSDVYDVSSKSERRALDGSQLAEW